MEVPIVLNVLILEVLRINREPRGGDWRCSGIVLIAHRNDLLEDRRLRLRSRPTPHIVRHDLVEWPAANAVEVDRVAKLSREPLRPRFELGARPLEAVVL